MISWMKQHNSKTFFFNSSWLFKQYFCSRKRFKAEKKERKKSIAFISLSHIWLAYGLCVFVFFVRICYYNTHRNKKKEKQNFLKSHSCWVRVFLKYLNVFLKKDVCFYLFSSPFKIRLMFFISYSMYSSLSLSRSLQTSYTYDKKDKQ